MGQWGRVLDTPVLVSPRNPKTLSLPTCEMNVVEDSALSQDLSCSAILRFCVFRQAINKSLLSTYCVPGTVLNAEARGL